MSISHVGPATVIALLEPFAPPPLLLMYVGRLANLVVGTLLLGVSLRMSSSLAPSLAVLALFPTVVTQTASLSADALTLGVSFVIAAYVAQWLEDSGPVAGRSLIVYFILAITVTLTKFGYWLLPWAIAVIPASRWGGARQKWLWLGVLAVVQIAVVGMWLSLVGIDLPTRSVVDPQMQFEQLVRSPGRGLSIAWSTLSANWLSLLSQFVGHLGYLDTHLPESFKLLSLVFLLLAPLLACRGSQLSAGQVATIVAICAGTIAIIGGTLYLTYSPVGSGKVIGLQGRYFVPLVPAVSMIVGSVLQPVGVRYVGPGTRILALRLCVPVYAS